MTSEQFERTRNLALRLAGIDLQERHRDLLDRKRRRCGKGSDAEFDALLDAAEAGHVEALRELIGLLTTNFTEFFRHPQHFEMAAGHALLAARRRGEAKLWSTAAATGEEPYSLAIALVEAFGIGDPPARILATDLSEAALAAARRGEYGEPALRVLAPGRRGRFFAATAGAGRWRIDEVARRLIEFRLMNLADGVWPIEGPLDVVFCRNVLMYLETACRRSVLDRVAALLRTGGLLILDPVEHLGQAEPLFTRMAKGVYSRRPLPRSTIRQGTIPAAIGKETL